MAYLRSGRNTSRDSPTRPPDEDINSWAAQRVMTRRSLWGTWDAFISTNKATWEFTIHGLSKLTYPSLDRKMFHEWTSESFAIREVCMSAGPEHSRIDPYRYKVADLASIHGAPQFSGGRIDFFGTLIQTSDDFPHFDVSCTHLDVITACAICPDPACCPIDDVSRHTSIIADSPHLGGSIA